jgi:hypothetical protein
MFWGAGQGGLGVEWLGVAGSLLRYTIFCSLYMVSACVRVCVCGCGSQAACLCLRLCLCLCTRSRVCVCDCRAQLCLCLCLGLCMCLCLCGCRRSSVCDYVHIHTRAGNEKSLPAGKRAGKGGTGGGEGETSTMRERSWLCSRCLYCHTHPQIESEREHGGGW